MSKIIYENACKSYGSKLTTGDWKKWTHGNYRDSNYYGTHITIQVYEEDGTREHASLIANYNGMRYQRNYGHILSWDHSIKIFCARFQKDILTNKIKPHASKRQKTTNAKRK